MDNVKAKRELLYSSLAGLLVFCVLAGGTHLGIVPAIYTVALGVVLGLGILIKLISILRSDSARHAAGFTASVSPGHAANPATGMQCDEPPIVAWIGIVPIPMSKRGYVLFLAILLCFTVIVGIVATWVRHHVF